METPVATPDRPTSEQGEQPTVPARLPSAAADRVASNSLRRSRLLAAQDWAQQATLENPRYRYRVKEGLQQGTLHPSIEKAILDIAWGKPQTLDKRLLDALGAGSRGLTLLLRKALTEDPLAEPKPVAAKVIIDQPPQEQSPAQPALTPRASIVPPARPSKRAQGKAVLRPGEEELT